MTSTEPVTVARRGVEAGGDDDRIVVRLRGEHDIATVEALQDAIDRAMALDGGDVVIDLGEVSFIGAAPTRVIRRAEEALRMASRSLTLRSASAFALQVLELAGLAHLVDPGGDGRTVATPGALASWVEVPAAGRDDGHTSGSSSTTGSDGPERPAKDRA